MGTTRISRLRAGQISVSDGHFCRWMAANQRAARLMFRLWLYQQTTNLTVLNTLECDRQNVRPSKLCLRFPNVFYWLFARWTCKTNVQIFRPANPSRGILNRFTGIYLHRQHPTRDDGARAKCVRCEVCIIPRLLEGRQIISPLPRYPECRADGDLSGPAYDALGCTRLEFHIIGGVDLPAKRMPICEKGKRKSRLWTLLMIDFVFQSAEQVMAL